VIAVQFILDGVVQVIPHFVEVVRGAHVSPS